MATNYSNKEKKGQSPGNKTTQKRAAGVKKTVKPHAHHDEHLVRLNRIRGQIEGIERMIQDGRYCVDIVNQMRSVMAAMKSVEGLVLEGHIRHCVKDAIDARDPRSAESKVNELVMLFNKR